MLHGTSLWERVRALGLSVESVDLEPLEAVTASGWTRRTTVVRLRGSAPDGVASDGVGEDVTYEGPEQEAFQRAGPAALQALIGSWDLASFSARAGELELFGAPPTQPASRHYRRWALESAALDLALRQNDTSLTAVLGRPPRPLSFVVSMGLGAQPAVAPVADWLAVDPALSFKLDASSLWTDELCAELAATGAVACVDLKGYYRGTSVDQELDPALYERVLRHFPGAIIEDAFVTDETLALLEPAWGRLAWDAPIHAVDDVLALPRPARNMNVKPSRFGSIERLSAFYEHAAGSGLALYGGGQFELGPGRGQAQLLAALQHPTAANDLAPSVYNTGAPRPGLPRSPLSDVAALADERGFRARA